MSTFNPQLISDEDSGYTSQPVTAALIQPDITQFQTKQIQYQNATHVILLQNSNGPCALLAIVNALILTPTSDPQVNGLVDYVAQCNVAHVTELLKYLYSIVHFATHLTNEEKEVVLSLLPNLNTGLPINPKFDGSFENTKELLIFQAFGFHLVHGWIISPEADHAEYKAISQRYNSFEGAQQLLINAYEANEKPDKSEQELQIIDDSYKVRAFFARCGTQLTDFGLKTLSRGLNQGQLYVFFRNNHFNTIVREGMEIFQLLTDLGFKEKPDYVWESLLSINGLNNSFFKGNFEPIFVKENTNPFADDASHDQQEDEDRALAVAIQEEEDQRAAEALQKKYQKPTEAQREAAAKKEKKEKKQKKKENKSKIKSCIIL